MAIVKLVCQGCGANLDALDNQRIVQCGYCGTSNQIKQTVYEAPAQAEAPMPTPVVPASSWVPPGAAAPPSPAAQAHYEQIRQQVAVHQAAQSRAAKPLAAIIVIGALLPLVIGGVVAWTAMRTVSTALDQVPGFGAGVETANGQPPQWRFESRPFAVDADGDGHEDLLGLIQLMGSPDVRLGVASGGKDWAPLWELSLGNRSTLPNGVHLYFDPEVKLAFVGVGATLTAYDLATGEQRWATNVSDMVEGLALEPAESGPQLWVASKDNKTVALQLADGKPTGATGPVGAGARVVADDEGYELIPDLRYLDLDWDQFEGLRSDAAFCPREALPFVIGRRNNAEDKQCSFAHGLAWASRAEGTSVPYWVGYDPSTKAERWRVQMTLAGSLETVDTGFSQPRAELFGDEALVAFEPSNGDQLFIRRISLVDGAQRWEAALSTKQGGQLSAMVMGKRSVYAVYNGRAYVFDNQTGGAQGTVGTWDW